jgi:hypothetical protein
MAKKVKKTVKATKEVAKVKAVEASYVLSTNVKHNGTLYPKGTEIKESDQVYNDLKEYAL